MAHDVKDHLRRALALMLKPLVRLFIAQGVTHAEFSETAKEVYVETALRHFASEGRVNVVVIDSPRPFSSRPFTESDSSRRADFRSGGSRKNIFATRKGFDGLVFGPEISRALRNSIGVAV